MYEFVLDLAEMEIVILYRFRLQGILSNQSRFDKNKCFVIKFINFARTLE